MIWKAEASPRLESWIRSSSARRCRPESPEGPEARARDMPPDITAAGWGRISRSALREELARLAVDVLERLLGRVEHAVRPRAAAALAGAQHHEGGAGGGPDHDCGRGADPVARVAHGRQLPGLQLVRGDLGEVDEGALDALGHVGGRSGRGQRLGPQHLEVAGVAHYTSPPGA